MRAWTWCGMLALVACLVAAPAGADVTVGFDVGPSLPTGDLSDGLDGGLSWQGHLTGGLVGALAVRGEIGRSKLNMDDATQELCLQALGFECDGELQFTHYAAGLQYGGWGHRGALGMSRLRLMPYGFFLVGAYQTRGELTIDFLTEEADDTFFGVAFGGGLNIRVGNNWGIQGDVHAHRVKFTVDDESSWESFVTPQAGIWVSF